MTDCFRLFYISESKNRGFVVEKKIKIRELSVWVISETSKNQQFPMKKLAKNQQLEKLFFFFNSKQLKTKVLYRNPILDLFHPCVYTQVIISKYL